MLISGAGLLAFGTTGLWNALETTKTRATLDARNAVIATADALRRAVRRPRVLDLVDEARQFEVADGQCVIPDALRASAWVVESPEHDLPQPLADTVRRARAEPDRALELVTEVHESEWLEPRERAWVATLRAFAALRAGDATQCDAMLDSLVDEPEDAYRSCAASVLLLSAERGRAAPDWAVRRAVQLDVELANGTIERLRGLGADGLATELERECRALWTKQQVLRSVSTRLSILLAARRVVVMPVVDELLLYFPAGDGEGRGALVDPVQLVDAIRARGDIDPVPWAGEIVRGDAAEGETIVADLCSLTPVPVEAAGWDGAIGMTIIVGALALCFVGASIANYRVVKAETEAVRTQSEFLQSVTHELKTPLASIRLLAERLESGRVEPDRQREYFSMLADETTRLSVLIENVLDLGRIERGERAYDRRERDVAEIVEEAVEVFRPLANRDGLRVDVESELGGVKATVDRGAIVQALLNVLENARKYATGSERVVVRSSLQDGDIVIDVRDFGPGVAPTEREVIFERFKRGARQQDGSIAGVGLGLHLARSIVRAHGGDLVCREPEGDGAEFRLRIPTEEAS